MLPTLALIPCPCTEAFPVNVRVKPVLFTMLPSWRGTPTTSQLYLSNAEIEVYKETRTYEMITGYKINSDKSVGFVFVFSRASSDRWTLQDTRRLVWSRLPVGGSLTKGRIRVNLWLRMNLSLKEGGVTYIYLLTLSWLSVQPYTTTGLVDPGSAALTGGGVRYARPRFGSTLLYRDCRQAGLANECYCCEPLMSTLVAE